MDGGVISPAKLANTLNISEIEGIAHDEDVLFFDLSFREDLF
jgi:hypothetical protein